MTPFSELLLEREKGLHGLATSLTRGEEMKGTKRKIWAAGLVGILVASVGLVSNPVVAAPKKTTINFFTFTAVPDHMKDLQAMVAAFEKKNPTIQVNIQTAAYADYFT